MRREVKRGTSGIGPIALVVVVDIIDDAALRIHQVYLVAAIVQLKRRVLIRIRRRHIIDLLPNQETLLIKTGMSAEMSGRRLYLGEVIGRLGDHLDTATLDNRSEGEREPITALTREIRGYDKGIRAGGDYLSASLSEHGGTNPDDIR